nr:reverse transcriptase domain-containing protein [Tanacetum cinerariifolium]
MPESNRGIRSHGKTNGVFLLCAGSLTNSLDTRDCVKIRITLPSGHSSCPYICINKLAPSVRPSTRSNFEKSRTPKEILAAEANKFQPPPPMVTPVEKRNGNKLCDLHNDKGHTTDECMQLKKQIE